MKKNTIAIVAGGSLSETLLPEIKKASYCIGVDRGAWWLLSHDILPNEAIGDFDSVTQEERGIIDDRIAIVSSYPKEKDATDLELGMEKAIALQPTRITIYGSIGSRMDHTLAGVWLLDTYSQKYEGDMRVVDENNELRIVRNSCTVEAHPTYYYYSLFSLTPSSVVSLEGFAYPLDHGILAWGSSLGVSNELKQNKGQITVHEGRVLLIRSRKD
jgi:thiamine pyrophosphokinase